jgi:glycine cleavage system protein P-like pyridoxal-binding family
MDGANMNAQVCVLKLSTFGFAIPYIGY